MSDRTYDLFQGGSRQDDFQSGIKATRWTQAQRDIAARAYENIIDIIGLENIKLLLPLWETTYTGAGAAEFSDMIRPHIKFTGSGIALGNAGLLNPVPYFNGTSSQIVQKALVEATAGSTEFAVNNATFKIAQKVTAYTLFGDIKTVQMKLKKTGSPVANMVIELVEDNAGQPTGASVATTEAQLAADVTATAGLFGFYFVNAPNCDGSKVYWLIFKYSATTTIGAGDYISVIYDNAGVYGQPNATWNGAAWTVNAGQSCAFEVYGDFLTVAGDHSIIAAFAMYSSAAQARAIFQPTTGHYLSDGGGVRYTTLAPNKKDIQCLRCGSGTADLVKQIVLPTYPVNEVVSKTFSYNDASDKHKIYRGATLLASGGGTMSTGANGPRQAFAVGVTRRSTGFTYYNNFYGTIGPVIMTSTVLTQREIGQIVNQLLAFRRVNYGGV
jgi:hypothetical protein